MTRYDTQESPRAPRHASPAPALAIDWPAAQGQRLVNPPGKGCPPLAECEGAETGVTRGGVGLRALLASGGGARQIGGLSWRADTSVNVYVYPTDRDWYSFLSAQPHLDEVNFWRPGGTQPFRQLTPGDLMLFRLRAPANAIAGGGIYTHFSFAPLIQVWEAFGIKNGTPDYATFLRLIARHKSLSAVPEQAATAIIGCIVLSDPFFLPPERWIPVPEDYPVTSPQGHRFDAATGSGRRLAEQVEAATRGLEVARVREVLQEPVRFHTSLARRRLGQGAFSLLVADAYERRCAISGEKTYPVLEAAHIRPVTNGGMHRMDNGLLLRTDIHRLFDRGYVTVTPTGLFQVSDRLREEWQNGRMYYDLHGKPIRDPVLAESKPAREFLEWHADTVFKG